MIGGLALRECLGRPEVAEVTSIGRRSVGEQHSKLTEVEHQDFGDFGGLDSFEHQDVALFCLGAYTGAVPDAQFREITVDYTVAFAKALHAASPTATVCFLSGQGADPSERSRIAFARYKGAAEKALLAQGFPRVFIFRPGYIYPVTPRREPNLSYRLLRGLYPLARRLYPNLGIASDDLALAMVEAGLRGTGRHESPILENRDIRTFAAELKR